MDNTIKGNLDLIRKEAIIREHKREKAKEFSKTVSEVFAFYFSCGWVGLSYASLFFMGYIYLNATNYISSVLSITLFLNALISSIHFTQTMQELGKK